MVDSGGGAAVGRFAEIIARVEAGESVRRICDRPGMPTRNEFRRTLAADPSLRARYDAAKILFAANRGAFYAREVKPTRKRFYSAKAGRLRHADEVIALVASGLDLHAACRARPGFPTPTQMRGQFRRDPDLERRYLAASRHLRRRPQRAITAAIVDAIIAEVAGGTLLRDACHKRSIKVPAFQHHALSAPDLRRRWLDAKEQGAAIRLAAGSLRFAGEILSRLEAGASLRAALGADPRYPGKSTFLAAIDTDAVLRARYDTAVEKSRIARRGSHLAHTGESAELWTRVLAMLPRRLDADQRHCIASDLVVAVLEGRLKVADLKRRVPEFVAYHQREFGLRWQLSLDAKIADDSNSEAFVDRIVTPGW